MNAERASRQVGGTWNQNRMDFVTSRYPITAASGDAKLLWNPHAYWLPHFNSLYQVLLASYAPEMPGQKHQSTRQVQRMSASHLASARYSSALKGFLFCCQAQNNPRTCGHQKPLISNQPPSVQGVIHTPIRKLFISPPEPFFKENDTQASLGTQTRRQTL